MNQDDRLIKVLDAQIWMLKGALNKHNALTYHDNAKSMYEHSYYSALLEGFEFARKTLTEEKLSTLESCTKFILATIAENKKHKIDNPYKLASIETKSQALAAVVSRLNEWAYCLNRLEDDNCSSLREPCGITLIE